MKTYYVGLGKLWQVFESRDDLHRTIDPFEITKTFEVNARNEYEAVRLAKAEYYNYK